MKTVLYLIQAEAELPALYLCIRKRNFLLLSYKAKTSDTTIFAPNSTWTEGRNLLYEYVKEHKLMYNYYVFMDADVLLFPTCQLTKYSFYKYWLMSLPIVFKILPVTLFSSMQESGYKSLEASFELNYPIVTLMFDTFVHKKTPLRGATAISTELPEEFRTKPIGKKSWLLQTITLFDAICVAVSRSAFFAGTVLPYTTAYDDTSWQLSNYIFNLKANFHYRNKIMRNNCFAICNSSNTKYKWYTPHIRSEIYLNLCKEFGVQSIKGSSWKKIPADYLVHSLRGRKHALAQFCMYALFVCSLPIAFWPMIIWVIQSLKNLTIFNK